jgi:8-oxo-dGTP pyrophosphatase MutT (NUDIX family)
MFYRQNMPHKLLYSTRWISLYEGLQGDSYVSSENGVMVVPLTSEGEVILIQEPTVYGDGEVTLYLPSGGLEKGEDPQMCADRELQEEIKLSAGRLDHLGQVQAWAKYLNAQLDLYLARDLTPSEREGDEGYPIVTETVALDSFETLLASGRLRDSSVIAALFLARRFLARET